MNNFRGKPGQAYCLCHNPGINADGFRQFFNVGVDNNKFHGIVCTEKGAVISRLVAQNTVKNNDGEKNDQ